MGSSMSFEGTSTVSSLLPPTSRVNVNVEQLSAVEPPTNEGSSGANGEAVALTRQDAAPSPEELSFSEEPVSIVDPASLSALGAAAAARGYLWIPLSVPGPAHRGRLGLFIEETIENELEERGALPPGIVASTGLDASVSDQLYRARLIEMRGIALGIPNLEGITNLGRTLDADDSSVLRWWMAATSDRPVRLLVSNQNTKLRVYPAPVFFDSLFDSAPKPVSPRPPSVDMAQSAESMELSDLPPAVALQEETNVLGTRVTTHEIGSRVTGEEGLTDVDCEYEFDEGHPEFSELDRALGLAPAGADWRAPKQLALDYESGSSAACTETVVAAFEPPLPGQEIEASLDAQDDLNSDEFLRTLAEDSARAPAVVGELVEKNVASSEDQQGSAPDETGETEQQAESQDAPSAFDPTTPEDLDEQVTNEALQVPTKNIARKPFIRFASSEAVVAEPQPATTVDRDELVKEHKSAAGADDEPEEDRVLTESAPVLRPMQARVIDPNDPFNQLAAQKWQSWVSNLIAARGPKPLSVIERMFVTDYTRLREAVRRGVADQSANAILDEWRDSFTSSYSEAYDALRVRGKRPTMVLDLPELSKRLGRLQGAKRVQLFLVDGMRFDLGLMVQERMRKCAAASLTERLLLWSALPTVTSHQLELLGRGPDGLKETPALDESPALVARGRAALTPRRVRTGSLEILKLDVVEDMLRQPGLPVVDRLDEIADITAATITEHIEKLPERTMLVVFGDHGFALDPAAAGTTAEVKQGGASPEEVLVPAFAWLTGATH